MAKIKDVIRIYLKTLISIPFKTLLTFKLFELNRLNNLKHVYQLSKTPQ